MTKETLKTFVAVLRVFVGAINKGNAITLHENEISNQVCRGLHKRKEKEIKHTRNMVGFVIKSLKSGRILYEAVDSWADDKLHRAKPLADKRLFGLTDAAIKYVEDHIVLDLPTMSDQFLLDMLRDDQFGVLPPERAAAGATVPAVLVEAVETIKQETVPQKEKETPPMQTNNNVARIVSEVRNIGPVCRDKSPERLLGALLQVSAFDEAAAAVAESIGWDPHTIKPCRDAIKHLNLLGVKQVMQVNLPGVGVHERHKGIFLTPLGRQVAEAGKFEDHVSPEQRWSRYDKKKKSSPLLKNSKKPAPAPTRGNIAVALPDGVVVYCSTATEAMAIRREFAESTAASGTVAEPAEATTAVAVVARPKMLGLYATIGTVLQAFTNSLCSAIVGLEAAENMDTVNVDGVSCALTEVQHVMNGLKSYVNRCVRENKPIDVKLLQDYAAQVELDVERIAEQREISVLADPDKDIGHGRILRGERSIKKTVWTP